MCWYCNLVVYGFGLMKIKKNECRTYCVFYMLFSCTNGSVLVCWVMRDWFRRGVPSGKVILGGQVFGEKRLWIGSVLFALLRSPQHLQRTNQRTVWEWMFLGFGAECGLKVSACGKCIALVFRYETSHFRKFNPFFSLWASCFSSLFSICLSVSLSCHLFLSGLVLWYFHLMQSG